MATNRWYTVVIGLGIAVIPIHNLWFTNLFTNSKGETLFFLPAFGWLLLIMGTGMFILNKWFQVKESGFGPLSVIIPMAIIILSMGISGLLNADSLKDKVSPLFMGVSLFGVYLMARVIGQSLFRALVPFVILGAVLSLILGILHPGVPASENPGLITNYCACAGFIIIGALVNQGKWQWVLCIVALVGVLFIGALESVFIVGVLAIAIMWRRDYDRRFLITASVVFGLVTVWALLGFLWPLFTGNDNVSVLAAILTGKSSISYDTLTDVSSGRWLPIVNAMKDIQIFGHGYSLGTASGGIVHNVPLIIVHQIGPIAGVAWLFLTVYLAIKTRWHYAWIGLLAMCVFDHYIWTQLTPYWWAMAGASLVATKSDLIFRR